MALQLTCTFRLFDTGEPGSTLGDVALTFGTDTDPFAGSPNQIVQILQQLGSSELRQRLAYLGGIAAQEISCSTPPDIQLNPVGMSPPIFVLPGAAIKV